MKKKKKSNLLKNKQGRSKFTRKRKELKRQGKSGKSNLSLPKMKIKSNLRTQNPTMKTSSQI